MRTTILPEEIRGQVKMTPDGNAAYFLVKNCGKVSGDWENFQVLLFQLVDCRENTAVMMNDPGTPIF